MIIVIVIIIIAFDRSGANRAVGLNISKAFDRVWQAGLIHRLKSYSISGRVFGVILSFFSNNTALGGPGTFPGTSSLRLHSSPYTFPTIY